MLLVIRDVRKAKGNKFSRKEVGKAFDDLVAWRLLRWNREGKCNSSILIR